MELELNPKQFEQHQAIFVEELVTAIMVKLVEAGLEGEKMEQLTAEIGFSIASIIDDTTNIESDGVEVRPYLTFRTDDEKIVHCGENAYSHEHVFSVLKKRFGS